MFDFQSNEYRYPSRREVVFARNGMVGTTQPLAAQAGISIMKQGGNAVDAAVAAAACMTVLEPTSNGVGSDAFALVWIEQEKHLYGLNASGKAPTGIDAVMVKELGYQTMPDRGWIPVMVPGAPSAWAELSQRFGRLPLKEVIRPAVEYAEQGYPVSPTASKLWKEGVQIFADRQETCFTPWLQMFAPDGTAPEPGQLWRSKELAHTLEMIGKTGAKAFYQGELADAIDRFSQETGGLLRKSDLKDYWCEWVEPIHINYKGTDVWEIPPNGDGIVALMALNLLKEMKFQSRDDGETFHYQLEAMKLAFADGCRYVTDQRGMKVTTEDLLSEEYTKKRRQQLTEYASVPKSGDPNSGGTVYLCTADSEGNMVSLIQSNYKGFGSGIVVPGTGISLQNRGANFSLDEKEDNCLAPGKKTFHTIIPGFLTRGGEAVGPFGVMGAFMQPQGHMQMVMNLIDFDLNPQEALDAPRWQWIKGLEVWLEAGVPETVLEELKKRGHKVVCTEDTITFGRGQIIIKDENGVLCGATEPRAGGTVIGF